MTDGEDRLELEERLRLVESMMLEGRRTTEYWGWMFLMWGVAYLIAIGWVQYLPHPGVAWPIVMVTTALVGAVVGWLKRSRSGRPGTVKSRALGGIWCAVAAAIFVFSFAVSFSHRGEPHVFLAAIEVLLGVANAASSWTLRWPTQMGVALVWWAAAVASCYVADGQLLPILVAANLVGNIGFGTYLMMLESRARARELRHA